MLRRDLPALEWNRASCDWQPSEFDEGMQAVLFRDLKLSPVLPKYSYRYDYLQ